MDIQQVIRSKHAHIKQYTDRDKTPPPYDVWFLDGLEFAVANTPVTVQKVPETEYIEKTVTLTEYKDRIIEKVVYVDKIIEVVKIEKVYLDRRTKEPIADKAVRAFYDLPDPVL